MPQEERERWACLSEEWDGKEVREGGDMGVSMADSCQCLTEQQKACNSPSIKK